MSFEISTTSGRRWARALDGLVVAWIVVWILVGAAVGWNLWQLRQLSTTMGSAADSLENVADALDVVGNVPLVGDRIDEFATTVHQTADDTHASAESSRDSISSLSYLLGIVVFVIPSVPVLGLCLPDKLRRRREIDEVLHALRQADHAWVDEFLAWRAITKIPFHELHELSDNPWKELREGRHHTLAGAEGQATDSSHAASDRER